MTVHLDGRHLEVSHSETIEPGSSSRILLKGEGLWMGRPSMPTRSSSSSSSANGLNASSKGKRGDLWIHVKAAGSLSQWIKGLSEEQRAQFESMLPPRRPALSAEKGETTRFPEAVILSVCYSSPCYVPPRSDTLSRLKTRKNTRSRSRLRRDSLKTTPEDLMVTNRPTPLI